jgi:hypothetical protein
MLSYLQERSMLSCRFLAAITLTLLLLVGSADGALIYWQNFDAGTGTPSITPGGGQLANVNARTTFSASGGVFGGSLDATANVSPGGASDNGIASTGATGGAAISGLPDQTGGSNPGTMNRYTVSFWVKTQAFSTNSGRAARLLTLGPVGTGDILTANSIGFVQVAGNAATGATKFAAYSGTVDLTNAAGIGNANSLNTWSFIALSYDGTSSAGNDSSVQLAATGTSTINGQFYQGTDTTSVSRFDIPITTVVGDATAASQGALNFGNSAILFLANRTGLQRAFDGAIDDIRIYDSVLSSAEIENVRLQGPIGVPEPTSCAIALGGIALLIVRRAIQRKD